MFHPSIFNQKNPVTEIFNSMVEVCKIQAGLENTRFSQMEICEQEICLMKKNEATM